MTSWKQVPTTNTQTTLTILRIVLPYIVFSGLWIFLSDTLLDILSLDAATHTQWSIYKGWAFVLVTALLLWGLLTAELGALERAQAAQRNSEEQLRLLGDNLPDSYVYQYTRDTDGTPRFLYLSSGVEKLHGVTVEDALRDAAVLHSQTAPEQAPMLETAVEDSLRNMTDFTMELRIRRCDGQWRWMRLCSRPRRESDGQVLWDGVATDITERKQSEAERRRLSDIIEKSLNEIYIFDSQTLSFLHANHGALKNLHYTLEEIKALTPLNLKPELSEKEFRGMIRPLLANELEAITFETVHRRADGSLYPVSVNLQLVDAENDRVFLAIIFDITERKRAEEEQQKLQAQLTQAQKMESVGRLAGGIAHDFNNMLSVIVGRVEMALMKSDTDHPLATDLREILKAAHRSEELTRQLLAFARKQPNEPTVLDMNVTVGEMIKMLQRLMGEDIELCWKPGDSGCLVKADPSQLTQILINLCVNARDAIDGVGRVIIETATMTFDDNYCATHSGLSPGEFVQLTVSDSGCGMDKETADRIFEPFFTTKEMGKGTGLGLATVYGIVSQNNGFISVHSKPEQGTTFRIYLPREKSGASAPKDGSSGALEGGNETILLVEDEPAVLEIGRVLLESLGYRVMSTGDPLEAIRLTRESREQVDLLITDVIMPKMKGSELARNLQSLHPHLACLFMSGYPADVIGSRGVLEEGVHFIQKPFSLMGFTAKVREVLDQGRVTESV
jgi:PAS domain S-box-containing protein